MGGYGQGHLNNHLISKMPTRPSSPYVTGFFHFGSFFPDSDPSTARVLLSPGFGFWVVTG